MAVGTRCADHVTSLYPQKLALTSPTGGGRSVGIVRSRTKATEFFIHNGMEPLKLKPKPTIRHDPETVGHRPTGLLQSPLIVTILITARFLPTSVSICKEDDFSHILQNKM